MDHGPLNSSNGFQSENQSMADSLEIPLPFTKEAVSTSNDCGPDSTSNNSGAILRYIDQILMEDDLEPHIMLQESPDFRAKERSFYEALGQKHPPSPPQQESSSLNVAQHVDDDAILRYIDQSLMEDDLESHIMLQESPDFRATERSFYDVLGQNYPPSPKQEPLYGEEDDEVNIERSSNSDQAMGYNNVPIQEFDGDVWVYTVDERDEKLAAYIANLTIAKKSKTQHGGPKIRRNEGTQVEEVIDLSAILIDCAKYVSAGNHYIATFLLNNIRRHSSPLGNGEQRLAHYLANGMDARVAGIGREIQKMTNPADQLRAYCVARISSSLRKISSFTSNKTIIDKSEKASRVHIIDFGILNGFQWPAFIKRVAEREGGPPKLRITGVDFPQAEGIIVGTGNRLASYAKTFGVPFEYKAIAQEWETIKIEDLKIEKGDFVAVMCSFRSANVMDVADGLGESPRDMFLKLVREISPDIFIHGIVNGGYNQPHFVYRFRDLLFHLSALFDMLETFLPRDSPERELIERDVLGKEALNVIACEGRERVERPETYIRWTARHVKAGFLQVRFEKKLMDTIMYKVRNVYHKDFGIDEDFKWMCMSWKGRVIHAMSCWQQPAAL